ncbi:MAG: hypothetical protein NTW21_39290 [Verrucomicrobia bacterium]|nr:hypothetical protein [Verrucomicrobiota bacterium]
MNTTPAQLLELLAAPEGTRIEFKSAAGGYHFDKLVEIAIRQSKPLPDFAGAAAHEVRLKLDGQVTDPKFVRFLERLGEEKLRGFSTYDFLALDAIAREQPLTEAMRSRLGGLLDAGVIESQGRGRGTRYHLSRSLYAALGKRGAYTRHRGLDHETNKALLLKHLHENAETGAPLPDLCEVLPALSRASIQRLLSELKQEGKARLEGQRRWGRWFPGPSMPQNPDPDQPQNQP